MDATTMEKLLYSWVPILVILGTWFFTMFRMRRSQTEFFSSPTATLVLNDEAEATQALKDIAHELREIRTDLGRLTPHQSRE